MAFETGLGILSTAESLVLTDRIHSAELYNGNVQSIVFKDFEQELNVIEKGADYVKIGTGAFSIYGRVGYIVEPYVLTVTPATVYYIVAEVSMTDKTAKLTFTTDPETISTTNLQTNPTGMSQMLLWTLYVDNFGTITEVDDRVFNTLTTDVALLQSGLATAVADINWLIYSQTILWRGTANVGGAVSFANDITWYRGFILGFSGGQGTVFLPNSYRGEDSRTLFGSPGTNVVISNPNVKVSLYNSFNGLTYLAGPYPIIYVVGVK